MHSIIKQVISFTQKQKHLSALDSTAISSFIEIFYHENKAKDFVDYSVVNLANSVISSIEFFLKKKPGEMKIRVYNPDLKKHGFECDFTIIDLINDDMPFLVDSTVSYLDRLGFKIKNIFHPTYSTNRDKSGNLQKICKAEDANTNQESVIQLHLDKITVESELKSIEENLRKILETVAVVVGDWKAMIAFMERAQKQIDNAKILVKDSNEIQEIREFISWIIDGNFILLGAKEFDIAKNKNGKHALKEVKDSGLGVFRSAYEEMQPKVLNTSFEEVDDSVANPYVIEILKSRYRSRIHRTANAERIRIQKISTEGKVIGEFRLVGLFTSSAFYDKITNIPLVRNKIAKVIVDSGYEHGSHNYKDLISVLDSYPRDELFQISPKDLLKNATGIVAICGRSQVRFFARKDKFSRFVSCLVYTPRDRSNSELREKVKKYLAETYHGEIADSFVQITDSNLTRQHVIVRTQDTIPVVDEQMVEDEITKMTKVWSDDLLGEIKKSFSEEEQTELFVKYKNSFSISYTNRFEAIQAVYDIQFIEKCLKKKSVIFNLYQSIKANNDITKLKIYSPGKELSLSEIMPILESFGFNVIQEQIYVVAPENDNEEKCNVWIHHFHLNLSKEGDKFSPEIKAHFEEAIDLIWKKVTRVGFLNRLVVSANLAWKQIYLLRAYTKYVYQTGFRYSQSYVADVMVKHRGLTKLLVELFEVKFNPDLKLNAADRHKEIEKITAKIQHGLNQVRDVTDDAVIRRFLNIITATLRTNYYQLNDSGDFKGYIAFKFDCKQIPELPLPVPHAEIFVYSPRFEAVHLRGGKVARGGLRWSDRHEDFRTEILGLMKAQTTKNAVIVPVGSKGGFVVKAPIVGLTREEVLKQGIECYKTFLRGLLDVTDNVINGKIVHPDNVIRYDGNDPYLVVAADKGTATFSDIANSVSAEYNFWLGDAFASGGSAGYDHKKMGITAKGGWISVMNHFREMGIDTQSQDFTCAGIGDLAGDVFGNGMLLSKHIKLVAAFNHMHIFLDPNPNSAKSYTERKRMFSLERSTWMDYNKSLISKGGGIFERSAKSIKISSEVKEVLGITEDELTPNALITAILKAPVDLLWNGGIGTYVKAADESHQEVGDRTNDVVRVNGSELRCRVVGEGGNLGFTQKGRIEYALNGGRVNTDAMDNSAGVDCSDHEVNIKIALTDALRSKKISLEKRNQVLESMTDEVAELVLSDNRLQTQAISIAHFQGASALADQGQFLDRLEKIGLLNRKVEFLPTYKEIYKKQIDKTGLTRPELCVMLAYAKMHIYNSLVNSNLVKDEYFEKELFSYFPKVMQQKFAAEIENHQLRNEIIATQITNFVVNRVGITFVSQMCHDTGFGVVDVVKSLLITSDSFRLMEVWEEIEKLGNEVAHHIKMQMFLSASKLLERSVAWLLRNPSKDSLTDSVKRFRKIADELSSALPGILAQASKESFEHKVDRYCLNNVGPKLAAKVAAMDPVASAFDIAEISTSAKFDIKTIAKLYFAVGTRFSLKWLRNGVLSLPRDNHWQKMATKTILEDLYTFQMKIAKAIIGFNCKDKKLCEIDSLEAWVQENKLSVERFDTFIAELKIYANHDLSVYLVALDRLKLLL